MREPWFVAFAFILLGVAVGQAMRFYRRKVLPRQATVVEVATYGLGVGPGSVGDQGEWGLL